MKKSIQSFFLKSSVNNFEKSKNIAKIKPFQTFSKTKKIGIIFNGFLKENIDVTRQFIDYFKGKDISCDALGFVNKKKMNEFNLASLNIDYFNLNDCNFFGFPNTDKVRNFVSEKFDILVNISEEEHLMYNYIVAHSLAKFKIGKNNNILYNLLINTKSKLSQDFVSEVIFYLDLISKNNTK